MVFSGLKSIQLDALMEISNVGVGNAATALSQMLNTSVEIRVPSVELLDLSDVADHLGGDDKAVLGMFLKMLGDASGNMLLIYPIESAERMVSLLLQEDIRGEELFSELSLSALKEVGNILASAYLSALGTMLDINLICSTPSISYDMAGAIIDSTLIELCSTEDKALVMETEFFLRGDEVKGSFFLIPAPGSLQVILAAAGQGK